MNWTGTGIWRRTNIQYHRKVLKDPQLNANNMIRIVKIVSVVIWFMMIAHVVAEEVVRRQDPQETPDPNVLDTRVDPNKEARKTKNILQAVFEGAVDLYERMLSNKENKKDATSYSYYYYYYDDGHSTSTSTSSSGGKSGESDANDDGDSSSNSNGETSDKSNANDDGHSYNSDTGCTSTGCDKSSSDDDFVSDSQRSKSSWYRLLLIVQEATQTITPVVSTTSPFAGYNYLIGNILTQNNQMVNTYGNQVGTMRLTCIRTTNFVCSWTIFSARLGSQGCTFTAQGLFFPGGTGRFNDIPTVQYVTITGGTGQCRGITGEIKISPNQLQAVPPTWNYEVYYDIIT